jgi:hypothetical protein
MKAKIHARALRPMIEAALRAAQEAPALERADIFDGIALVLRRADPKTAADAKEAAKCIREAEQRQLLLFRNLIDSQP